MSKDKPVRELLKGFQGEDDQVEEVAPDAETLSDPWPSIPVTKSPEGILQRMLTIPKERITTVTGTHEHWEPLLEWIAGHPDNADLRVACLGVEGSVPDGWTNITDPREHYPDLEMPDDLPEKVIAKDIAGIVAMVALLSSQGLVDMVCIQLDNLTCPEKGPTLEQGWSTLVPLLVHFLRKNDLAGLILAEEENTPKVFRFFATRRWVLSENRRGEGLHFLVKKDKVDVTTGYEVLLNAEGEPILPGTDA